MTGNYSRNYLGTFRNTLWTKEVYNRDSRLVGISFLPHTQLNNSLKGQEPTVFLKFLLREG